MLKKLEITLIVAGLIGLVGYGLYLLAEFALTWWALSHVIL